uniref:Syntaxin 19 n=1 Tax=Callorhinchus milii TaxID=7868 RepID=A0A4W3GM43_CALMI|eukprot:gi/632940236/ref/XP_007885210.1/ PREDICTED: syntaxin-19 [Callorhinchus milii]
MKDRLQEFKQSVKEIDHTKKDNEANTKIEEDVVLKQQAIIFEKEPVLEHFLMDAQRMQEEINELNNNIKKLRYQSSTIMASMRRFSVIKKDNVSLIKDLKIQAESIHKHLDALSKDVKQSVVDFGADAVITRMKKNQHTLLLKQYEVTILEFNNVLIKKKENCKAFIQRQLEVVGKDISEEELNNMVEYNRWYVFNENFLHDIKITKSQLSEIEQRHKELRCLENQLKELQDLFLQTSILVQTQGDYIDNIEKTVMNTKEYTEKATEEIKLAAKYRKKNPCRTLCCWCFPCFNIR